jgi:hypothetical protein
MLWKIKKTVLTTAAVVLTVAWFTSGFLENLYVNYPRSPNPQDGRTVTHAVKGIIVYITKSQQELLSWLTWIEIGSGMVVVLLVLIDRRDSVR